METRGVTYELASDLVERALCDVLQTGRKRIYKMCFYC